MGDNLLFYYYAYVCIYTCFVCVCVCIYYIEENLILLALTVVIKKYPENELTDRVMLIKLFALKSDQILIAFTKNQCINMYK